MKDKLKLCDRVSGLTEVDQCDWGENLSLEELRGISDALEEHLGLHQIQPVGQADVSSLQ